MPARASSWAPRSTHEHRCWSRIAIFIVMLLFTVQIFVVYRLDTFLPEPEPDRGEGDIHLRPQSFFLNHNPFRHATASSSLFSGLPHHFDIGKWPSLFDEKVPEFLSRVQSRMTESQIVNGAMYSTIFVGVPSYRDDECPISINNLFERAADPSRVFVGLCDQLDESVDQTCLERVDPKWHSNIRSVNVPSSQADGPNTARYFVSKLWDGEEFYLSVDAHTRFMKHWDTVMLHMARQLPDNAIFTHYPVAKQNEIGDNDGHIPWLCKGEFHAHPPKLIVQSCGECHSRNRPGRIACVGPFIGAGFFFGHSTILTAAPPDRYLPRLFHGEELLLAARLWTSGFDIYSPTTNVISHVYGSRKHNVFMENNDPLAINMNMATHHRVHFLLGATDIRPSVDDEIEHLGMGTKRSLQEYMDFAGLDLLNEKQISRCNSYFDWETHKWVELSQ